MKNEYSISVLNFAKDAIEAVFNTSLKHIKWGEDNLLPYNILNLYRSVAEHSSTIDFLVDLIIEEGIQLDGKDIEGLDYWTVKKLAYDFILFGGYTIETQKTRGGLNKINYLDISKCRISDKKDKVLIGTDWLTNKFKNKTIDASLIKDIKEVGVYMYRNILSRGVYPEPYYSSSILAIDTLNRINKYHNNNAKSGWSPNILISMNNGTPSDETKSRIEKGLAEKYTGESSQKFIIFYNDSKETAPEIVKLDQEGKDDRFTEIQKFTQNQILVAHKLTSPVLIGIVPESKGFAKTEYEEALGIFKSVTVKSLRNEFLYSLNTFLGVKDIMVVKETNVVVKQDKGSIEINK